MGAIYTGLVCRGGYLFTTNDAFGETESEGAIHRVNRLCGALIVTARGGFLRRVKDLLTRMPAREGGEGLSAELARDIVSWLEEEFARDPSFRVQPLPFLLLLVGYGAGNPGRLEWVFLRHRVVNAVETAGAKHYSTEFDVQAPAAAESLFFGHAELTDYLYRQLPPGGLGLESMMVFSSFAMAETRKIDQSIYPHLRMAVLSPDGFRWVGEAESARLSALAGEVDGSLAQITPVSEERQWNSSKL